MFKGYPGETARDMEATAGFLEKHGNLLDRVRFNDFTLTPNTRIWETITDPDAQAELEVEGLDNRRGKSRYRNRRGTSRAYRKAKARALQIVYEINRKPLRDSARQFDGLM